MRMTVKRRILVRAAVLCAATATSLFVAEVAIRVLLPQDVGLLAPWYESHPVYRVRDYLDMNAMRTWGSAYRLRTNSRGIRSDVDEPYESPSDPHRRARRFPDAGRWGRQRGHVRSPDPSSCSDGAMSGSMC
jgi:hypothetical protein